MLNHTEIQAKYAEASQEVKDLLSSQKTIDDISSLGKKHSLQIDELGKIEELVTLFALGLTSEKEFHSSVLEITSGDSQKAKLLLDDINNTLFIPIRKSLIEGSVEKPAQISNAPVNRDDILSAIENPAPTEHPISIAQPKPVEKTRPSSEATVVAHTFIGEKLSAPVSLPSQKTTISPTSAVANKPKPSVDPYREPIN